MTGFTTLGAVPVGSSARADANIPLVGARATTSAGALVAFLPGQQPLTGARATAGAGALGLTEAGVLVGAPALASAGLLSKAATYSLTGTRATVSARAVLPFVIVVNPYRTLISQTVRIRALGRNIPNPSRSL